MKWAIRLCLLAAALLILLLIGALIPVRLSASELVVKEQRCMAEAVYFEARDQNFLGQIAVAVVIHNRTKDNRWPSTICGVVKEGLYWRGNPVKYKCQFSYWCDGRPERPTEKEAWAKALDISKQVLENRISIESLQGATHYHATTVRPFWAKKLEPRGQIGDHKFYAKRRKERLSE